MLSIVEKFIGATFFSYALFRILNITTIQYFENCV